jgi:hypothetical protein
MTTSHMSQGPCSWNCGGPWSSSKGCTTDMVWQNLYQALPLRGGPAANSDKPWNFICHVDLSIHEIFFGPLGLHILVWSELGRSRPFRPMRDLRMQWRRPFSPVCWSGPKGRPSFTLTPGLFSAPHKIWHMATPDTWQNLTPHPLNFATW